MANTWERKKTVQTASGAWNGGSLLSGLSLTDNSYRIIVGVDYGTTYTGMVDILSTNGVNKASDSLHRY